MGRKIDPGLRHHLPELADLIRRLMREAPRRGDVYAELGGALGVSRSVMEQYTLAERKRRKEVGLSLSRDQVLSANEMREALGDG